MTLAISMSAAIPLLILFIMLVFGLYSSKQIGWVAFCLICGGGGYYAASLINPWLFSRGVSLNAVIILLAPIIQQVLVSISVFIVLFREKSVGLTQN